MEPSAKWRDFVDRAKQYPWLIRSLAPLGRGKGRLRFVDRISCRALVAPKPDLSRWNVASLAACWIGHATVLLRIGGKTVLTDPVFATRVGPGLGICTAGPARIVAPALRFDELPPIDVVLVSHAHFDHLCRPTLWTLSNRFRNATLITTEGVDDLTHDLRFSRRIELGARGSIDLGTLRVESLPVEHWSPRMLVDHERGSCAYMLTHGSQRVLFGGDSADQSHWAPLGTSGGCDLACVGIGAYDPWIQGHANPEQAWRMARRDAGARYVLPMHHSTFKLSEEPMDEPMKRLMLAAGTEADRVVCRSVGDVWYA
jgi:L-ascorbate metabolism protein UlaG (beta-lactamase superfamily)